MASPKLSVARSNYEGRGYADVFNLNNGMPVPSVTTVLKSLSEEGLIQWAVEQTAAYAVMNVDKLAQIPDEKGFALLRYYWKRMNSAKVDDPWTDLNNYHTGVLNDAAQMGTWIHTFIEAHMNKWDLPEPERIEHEQMANAYLEWCQENFVTVYATEATIFGNGYAGTSDWFAEVNGVKYLGDNKGLPLDTLIPTPTGWTTMAELQVGDEVFDELGAVCRVTEKSEVHHNPCLEFVLDTGEKIISDTDHRWVVYTGQPSHVRREVLTGQEILERGVVGRNGQKDLRILVGGPLELPDADLPIDPYVLGVWIGDGTRGKSQVTLNRGTKAGIPDIIRSRGWEVSEQNYASVKSEMSATYRIGPSGSFVTTGIPPFKKALKDLGVLRTKKIPDAFLRASQSQRLDLLRGIMDTDGGWNIARNGEVVLCTTDEVFAGQVSELAASLGEKPLTSEVQVSWKHKGVKKKTTGFRVTWRPAKFNPFLARDYPYELVDIPSARNRRYLIKEVNPADTVPTQCITVDSPLSTYRFGKQMMVTHNTSRAVRNSHLAQLGALGAGHTMAKEVTADTPGAFKHLMEPKVAEELGLDRETYWEPVPLPDFTNYGILQVRPDDYDSKGNFVPAFCQFHPVPQEVVEAAFEVFKGGLAVAYGNLAVKKAMKETGFGH